MNHRLVASMMRTIIKEQYTLWYMPKSTVRFIFDTGLLKLTTWPSWCITVTEAGSQYMQESEVEPCTHGKLL